VVQQMKVVTFALIVALSGSALALWYAPRVEATSPYRTAPAKRLDIAQTINATGTVVPEDVVDVGAQVNGQIAAFGTDTEGHAIDFRSTVTKGMVLARIDDALYAADVATADAQLAQANAQVSLSEANLAESNAKLEQMQHEWDRAQLLAKSPALSQTDFDAARSDYDQALAAVAIANAQIAQGHAEVASAQAAVTRARRNLTYCTILSPVDGVILDRRVEIGQTVVASLNAPSLFLIAKDLKRMRVLVQVNEADIGHVAADQPVTFTVDALPNQTFSGTVRKVRLNATLTQNVVTYTVEISTDNSSLALLPYLTANVVFEVARKDKVLAVPNAALRWSPREVPAEAASAGGERRGSKEPTVWVVDAGKPRPVAVHTGLTDGSFTEVEGQELAEGTPVIVGDAVAAGGAPAQGASPFTPQLTRGRSSR
jgi:HlyD family secretion protein